MVPPLVTERQIEVEGITVDRIEGGKIVEEWERYDNLGVMEQLGLVPEQELGRELATYRAGV